MIRTQIKKLLLLSVRKKFKDIAIPPFSLETPENTEHGDYATNIALVLARLLKKNPLEIASALVEELKYEAKNFVAATAPPGFINFSVKEQALWGELDTILKENNNYGRGKKKSVKIQVEFISANPTGPIHIGNGRGAFLGDALVRILNFAGFKAQSEYYVNDARASEQIKNLGASARQESDAYPYIASLYLKKSPALAKKLKILPAAEAGYSLTRFIQKENEKVIKKVFKIKFNKFFSEDSLYQKHIFEKVLRILQTRDLVYQKDGALWLRASHFGDTEDRVLIRSTGEPTYAMSDIAYHWDKFKTRRFDKVIDIWGADHHGYAPRLKAAMKALGLGEDKMHIIITQFVRLVEGGKEVKMSKRKGEFVTLENLVKLVGLDAARYFFLGKTPDTHLDFNIGLAKERSVKNPVYYIQYAYARIAAIFRKAKNRSSPTYLRPQLSAFSSLKEREELFLIKKLIQFPGVIEDTASDYQVQRLTRYAYELARAFHNFYEKQRVIIEDKKLTRSRMSLVKATQIVLKNTLDLLGVSAPERM